MNKERISWRNSNNLFEWEYTLEEIMSAREYMIKSGQLKSIETIYGTLEIIIHPLFKGESWAIIT